MKRYYFLLIFFCGLSLLAYSQNVSIAELDSIQAKMNAMPEFYEKKRLITDILGRKQNQLNKKEYNDFKRKIYQYLQRNEDKIVLEYFLFEVQPSRFYVDQMLKKAQKFDKCFQYELISAVFRSYNVEKNFFDSIFSIQDIKNYQKQALADRCLDAYVDLLSSEATNLIRLQEQDLAIERIIEALKFAEKNNLRIRTKLLVLHELTTINNSIKNYEKSALYYRASLPLHLQNGDSLSYLGDLNNLAYVYREMGKLNLAKTYFEEIIQLAKQIKSEVWEGIANGNLGACYQREKKYALAIPYFLREAELVMNTPNKGSALLSLLSATVCYIELNDLQNAEKLLKQINTNLDLLSPDDQAFQTIRTRYLYAYHLLYGQKKDYEKALKFYQRYVELRDSLENNEMVTKIHEIQTAYKVEQKDKKNLLLEQANQEKDRQIKEQKIGVGIGILLLFFASLAIFFLNRANKERSKNNALLLEKNVEISQTLIEKKGITDALDKSAIVSISDLKGRIIKVNEMFCQISGYSEAELLGKDHRIINSGNHPKEFWIGMWKTIAKGETWRAEVCNRSKNGQLYWVDTIINPVYDAKGKICQYFSIRTVVTARKKAEQALQENKEKLKSILDEVQDVIWSVSLPNYHTLFVSPSVQKLYGISVEEWLNDNSLWLKIMHTEDVDIVQKIINSLESTGKSYAEYRIITAEGLVKWVSNQSKYILDQNNVPFRVDGITADITARKKAEQIIQIQNQELQDTLGLMVNLRQKSEASKAIAENLLKNLKDNLNYSLRIQNAIMPKESELQKHFDCFVFFRPKDIVSGDFYWFADKGDKKILIAADCTGHGVSGAFMTMIGNNILNQIVHNYEIHEPDEILNLMPILLEKTLLHSEGKVSDGMDISIISLSQNLAGFENPQGFQVSYAGAMNPLYYVQNKVFKEIKADKRPIGGKRNDDFSYQKHTLELPVSSDQLNKERQATDHCTFYLCSDGFQDQFGGENDSKFMVKNLKKLLLEISERPLAEQKVLLDDTFDAWQGFQKQTDDVLVIGLRI